ncbi:Crp/Fnr family transcriptional regulator [Foetidibacter luteolus]|uniref:Crp/Fnr family transcriptional regulator n=1 Tax=Foetidibacter luteolus TaxID=2608880 RepID=UPI00129BA7F1|nr:Crp/Fnr family transcriptional regulator [Foetidibacter luteolus]
MDNKYSALQIFMLQMQMGEEAWQDMRQRLTVKICLKKQQLVTEGKPAGEIYFITKGSFRFYKIIDGIEVTTFFSFENQWTGAYTSYTNRTPAGITIEAMEDAEVLALHYDDLQQLYQKHRSAERFGRLMAEYLVSCLEDRMHSLLLKTPEERYLKTLTDHSIYFERVPQHYIASYLGVAPESLSRIRKRVMQRAIS